MRRTVATNYHQSNLQRGNKVIAEKNSQRLGHPQLRVALLLLTGAFCLSNGIWD
jgi:hypothetical protein